MRDDPVRRHDDWREAPGECRRAYYRVNARVPIRAEPIPDSQLEAAIFELTTPNGGQPVQPGPDEIHPVLLERLIRIEEKLDRLLGYSGRDETEPLGAADLEWIVFSGSGLSMPVEFPFHEGDWFRIEILLPAPENRLLRGVGRAVEGAKPSDPSVARFELPVSLEYMPDEDRDALVAYSYELQRVALRSREEEAPR